MNSIWNIALAAMAIGLTYACARDGMQQDRTRLAQLEARVDKLERQPQAALPAPVAPLESAPVKKKAPPSIVKGFVPVE